MKKLLCFFGVHSWEYYELIYPLGKIRQGKMCLCCGKKEELRFLKRQFRDYVYILVKGPWYRTGYRWEILKKVNIFDSKIPQLFEYLEFEEKK